MNMPSSNKVIEELGDYVNDPANASVMDVFREIGERGRMLHTAEIASDPEWFARRFVAWIRVGAPTCSRQALNPDN